MDDAKYMRQALELAALGAGFANPNPQVGCVLVKDGRVIGQGYHTAYGKPHAEREALAAATENPAGATAYVTLEPCCHTGKTPPCTEALIDAGVARVVVGTLDANPKVAGNGARLLREAGITVDVGVLEQECLALNRAFFHHIRTQRPFVTLKYAMTLDGKIATRTGASRWITGEEARQRVHRDRHGSMAIMVGVGTVLADDPLLTCRLEATADGRAPHQPLRVVCDTHLRTPLDSQLVRTAEESPVLIATAVDDAERMAAYQKSGCRVEVLPLVDGHVDPDALMDLLGAEGVDSVLCEGGAQLNESLLQAGLAQWVQCYVAPKLFGGTEAPGPIGGTGVDEPAQAWPVGDLTVTQLGHDLLLEGPILRSEEVA